MNTLYNFFLQKIIPYDDNLLTIGDNLLLLNNTQRVFGRHIPQQNIEEVRSTPFRAEQLGIFYCHSGSLHINLNLSPVVLNDNDLLLIRPNSIVSTIGYSNDVRVMHLTLGSGFTPFETGVKNYVTFYQMLFSNPVLHLSEVQRTVFMHTFLEIENAIRNYESLLRDELVQAYLHVLYTYLIAFMREEKEQNLVVNKSRKMWILDNFLHLVEQNFYKERLLGFYAHKLCITPKHLAEIIRSTSGKKATQWIEERTILEAKVLLLDGKYNIQQVSDMLNFPSQSFFGRYFKNAVGVSPSDYILMGK